ncbi:MAG: PhzF family phenazine biosynthesis protein [Natronospirillum sp.]
MNGTLHRLSAFTDDPAGGNPAGVWLGEALPDPATMQNIAAEVGYSETVFIAPLNGRTKTVRYYSPLVEISFCGHATIAAGVLLARTIGEGTFTLDTLVGPVTVTAITDDEGRLLATLESVPPQQAEASPALVQEALSALAWSPSELNAQLPPIKAYAGAWHLILAAGSQSRLSELNYDVPRLKTLMEAEQLATVQLIYRENEDLFRARNPFPTGGVYEDPATGASAAALGGYLRDAKLVTAPFRFTLLQGEDMGRPSKLEVEVPVTGGIKVSGGAVDIVS